MGVALAEKDWKEESAITLDIRDIESENELELSIACPFKEIFESEDGVEGVGDLKAEFSFTRHERNIYVTGKAGGTVKLWCGRCLKEYKSSLDMEIEVAFFPAEKEEGNENDYTYEGDIINLSGLLREQFILTLPLRRVCREECNGLCPKCGADLNEGDCDCPKKEVDERLAVLKRLKDK